MGFSHHLPKLQLKFFIFDLFQMALPSDLLSRAL